MTVAWVLDSHEQPACGVHGGAAGGLASATIVDRDGVKSVLPAAGQIELQPGQVATTIGAGGGGFGDPHDRDPELVLADVLEGYVTRDAAMSIYGVALAGEIEDGSAAVDREGTEQARSHAGST